MVFILLCRRVCGPGPAVRYQLIAAKLKSHCQGLPAPPRRVPSAAFINVRGRWQSPCKLTTLKMCLAPNKQPDQPTLPNPIQKQEMRKAATDKHKIGVWNCAGLSHERYQYLQGQGFDVLALLELHGSPVKWEGRKLIVSERPEEGDPASGVAIMLSPRMQKDDLAFGKVGSRIV